MSLLLTDEPFEGFGFRTHGKTKVIPHMHPESITTLDKHRHIYTQLNMAGTLNIGHQEKEDILNVIRREWDGGYLINMYCGDCIAGMVKYAYVQYDKYLAK